MLVSKKVLSTINVLTFMASSNTVAAVYLFLATLAFAQPYSGFAVADWVSFAVLGIVSQVVGWMSLSYALQYIEAQKVSLSLLSQAIITALLAVLFIGETLTLQMIIGGLFILVGIGITFMKSKQTVTS
jgi:drug/metabolite transporter (DMT)-like permease